jgi:cell surface protein SprA
MFLFRKQLFGQQTRRFIVNGTFLYTYGLFYFKDVRKTVYTKIESFGQESVNNTIFGFNTNFQRSSIFNSMKCKLPNVDTEKPSNTCKRRGCFFKTRYAKSNSSEKSTIYVDDFEGSQQHRHALCLRLSLSSTR